MEGPLPPAVAPRIVLPPSDPSPSRIALSAGFGVDDLKLIDFISGPFFCAAYFPFSFELRCGGDTTNERASCSTLAEKRRRCQCRVL